MADEEQPKKPRPNLSDNFRNFWESDIPFFERLGIAMANNFTKLRKLDTCCGNYGQPGC